MIVSVANRSTSRLLLLLVFHTWTLPGKKLLFVESNLQLYSRGLIWTGCAADINRKNRIEIGIGLPVIRKAFGTSTQIRFNSGLTLNHSLLLKKYSKGLQWEMNTAWMWMAYHLYDVDYTSTNEQSTLYYSNLHRRSQMYGIRSGTAVRLPLSEYLGFEFNTGLLFGLENVKYEGLLLRQIPFDDSRAINRLQPGKYLRIQPQIGVKFFCVL